MGRASRRWPGCGTALHLTHLYEAFRAPERTEVIRPASIRTGCRPRLSGVAPVAPGAPRPLGGDTQKDG